MPTLVQNFARTVVVVSPQPNGCGCNATLAWPIKFSTAVEDFYIDVSAETTNDDDTITSYTVSQVNSDTHLTISEIQQIGSTSVIGFLASGGTIEYTYGICVTVTFSNGNVIPYYVALPIGAY